MERVNRSFVFPGACWNLRADRSSRQWNVWPSLQSEYPDNCNLRQARLRLLNSCNILNIISHIYFIAQNHSTFFYCIVTVPTVYTGICLGTSIIDFTVA